jgi:hypothetical protein
VSWLTLLLTSAGVLVAVVAVASVVLGRVSRGGLSFAAATVAAVIFLTFAAPQIHGALSFLNGQRLADRGLPAEKAREKCLVDGGNPGQVGFLEFVRRVVPGQSRVVVVGPMPVDAACLTFVLLPRLLATGSEKASWAIFTAGVPPSWNGKIVPGTERTFKPGQLVARLRR